MSERQILSRMSDREVILEKRNQKLMISNDRNCKELLESFQGRECYEKMCKLRASEDSNSIYKAGLKEQLRLRVIFTSHPYVANLIRMCKI